MSLLVELWGCRALSSTLAHKPGRIFYQENAWQRDGKSPLLARVRRAVLVIIIIVIITGHTICNMTGTAP